jgi:hypothetical protein
MGRATRFLIVWAASGLPALAAPDWVSQVLPERAVDLGTVARGSRVLHSFRLINRTNQEIHIADWRTKCGCTEVRVGAREIPPATQTVIEAVIDTTKFQGFKATGLTLVLDRPSYVEVDLNLTCFIQGEVVLTPGQVDFGIVRRGTTPTVTLTMNYMGSRPDFAVKRVRTRTSDVTGKVQRVSEGVAQFVLTATLSPTIETGYFRDEFTLSTNDPAVPTIPISVSAQVQSAVTLSPSVLNLGRVRPGQVVRKSVLVRAAQPFRLTDVKAGNNDPSLSASPDPDGARPMHTVNLTFKAPEKPGPYHGVCEIATDLKDEPVARLSAFATVGP